MSSIFSLFSSTPKHTPAEQDHLSMSDGIAAQGSPSLATKEAQTPRAHLAPKMAAGSQSVSKLLASHRKQKAKPPATVDALDLFTRIDTPVRRLSAVKVYGSAARKSAKRAAQDPEKSHRKKKIRRLTNGTSVSSLASTPRSATIPGVTDHDDSSSGPDEDIPASVDDSVIRPGPSTTVDPVYSQTLVGKSLIFGDEEQDSLKNGDHRKEQQRSTRKPKMKRTRFEGSASDDDDDDDAVDGGGGGNVEVVTAEASSAAIDPYDMDDGDDSVHAGESTEMAEGDDSVAAASEHDDHEEEEGEQEPEEEIEVYEIDSILGHQAADEEGDFDLEVQWRDGSTTLEPEEILHEDCPRALFAYWRSVGGRPDDGSGIYRTVAIHGVRTIHRTRKVLVEWLGYPQTEMTWEPRKEMLRTAKELVEAYEDENPSAQARAKEAKKAPKKTSSL